jgi:hypothetical protein
MKTNLTSFAKMILLASFVGTVSFLASGQGTAPPCCTPPYTTDRAGNPTQLRNSWPQGAQPTVVIDERFRRHNNKPSRTA